MQKGFLKYVLLLIAITIASCAKRGTISGGAKDTIAPKMIGSLPKNFATNFTGNTIRINFDEYIKLKDVNKQLIISPPMKKAPEILPSTASKYINIRIKDTLRPNTTYSFNFGKSIQDNNEGNPFQQFKYVFSTGNYIDSLTLGTRVKDAVLKTVPNYVSIMLYEADQNYTDSIVYKQVPRYVTSTLDSIKLAKFENLKQGKYKLVAMKDVNGNNKFDPKVDKIGFKKGFITVPNDSIYELALFKEDLPFKAINLSQASISKFTIGYEGNPKDVKINIKKGTESVPYLMTKFPKKDSLQVWFKAVKGDSLSIDISKNKFHKVFPLKYKEMKKDSIAFSPEQTGTLNFRETFTVNSIIPITKWDVTKMKLINKDSAEVKFTTEYDEYRQQLKFKFDKQPLEKYKLKLLAGALTDYNDKPSDSLLFSFSTNNLSDYGNLKVVLEHVKRFPVIVQLTNDKGEVLASEYSEKETTINFDLLEPNKFTLRVIYDDNKDKRWTPGSFLDQRQSEEVIYYPKEIDVRANWDVEQPFDVGNSN